MYRDFWEEIWLKYPETKLVYETEKGIIRETFYRGFFKDRTGLTLDLGCGDGHIFKFIKNPVGMDISFNSLCRFQGDRICSICQILPFQDGVFDTVVLCEVFEHLSERELVICEVRRVLKDGGHLILSSPYGKEPFRLGTTGLQKYHFQKYGIGVMQYPDGRFDEAYITDLLNKCGIKVEWIKVVSIKSIPNNIFVLGVKDR